MVHKRQLQVGDNRTRLLVLVACIFAGFSLLTIRLLDIQAVRFTQFRALADANRFAVREYPSERGVFLDRYGEQLVENVPKYFHSNTRGTQVGSGFLNQTEALFRKATASAEIGYQLDRRYRYPESLAHVQGYVGSPTLQNLIDNRSIKPTDLLGKAGLERVFDQQLQGMSKRTVFEVNALGEPQRLVSESPVQPGLYIRTTLDPLLSEVAYQALGDQRGVVIITDTQTGELLSLVSKPAFSSTTMSEHRIDASEELLRKKQVQEFMTHPQKLFFNRAISGTYPPGSVFKLVTALAALESSAVDSATTILDEGTLKVGEYEYANWYFTQYGRVEGAISLRRALARSNDIYFYKAAEQMGPTKLAEYARIFGFGEPTEIELPGEASGTVPDPVWKEQTIGEQWFLGNTYHFGIGQGDILVTPLQVSQLNQAVGNKGRLCAPHLLSTAVQSGLSTSVCSEVGVTDEHLSLVLGGMLDACTSGGTAFPFFPVNDALRHTELDPYQELEQGAVACKTGTAEFGAADEKGYRSTHGWFITTFVIQDSNSNASAPVSEQTASSSGLVDPARVGQPSWAELYSKWLKYGNLRPKKISITVLVESDEVEPFKEGSRDAAPVAKRIYDWMSGVQVERPILVRDTQTEGE